MSRMYIVYKYTFADGSVYIGRTYEGSGRYDNPEKYKNQEVYKHFKNGYTAEILFSSENPFITYFLEHQYILENYENSHNGNQEYE